MSYKVAVVGASGNVGREMLAILAERNFPVSEVVALASARSAGKEVSFGDKDLKIQDLAKYDFKGTDFVFSSPGGTVSAEFAPKAAAAGAIVIDNTSHFRMDEDVPLIVPEVNGHVLDGYMQDKSRRGIIANPNCSTIQMLVALKPIHDAANIKRIVVSTYQSVSGAGKEAMDELFNQSRHFFMNDDPKADVFPKQIAFNVIPQIDKFIEEGEDEGMTKEEWKMVVETKKILDVKIEVCANCVRMPVFIGHAEMVNIELEKPLSVKEAKKLWRDMDGVTIIDRESEMEYITPAEIAGEDAVFVSRVRLDKSVKHGLNFWCVSDNMRKGAALNSIQIAETLIGKEVE